MTQELKQLATDAVKEITISLLNSFTTDPDTSYKRAMFRQNGEYGCSLVIDVLIEDGDKRINIKTKFGKM